MRDGGGGFTFRQFAFRAVIICLIGRGIDLVQGLACLYIAAFSEITIRSIRVNLQADWLYGKHWCGLVIQLTSNGAIYNMNGNLRFTDVSSFSLIVTTGD